MNRRSVIAGVGSLAVVGLGGWFATSGQTAGSGNRLEPVTIETLEVAGSPGEPVTVPFAGSVTVIDLFGTWCTPCIEHMATLEEARAQLGDGVTFVSVTNEAVGGDLTRDDIEEWWRKHGGSWTVGLDDEGKLTRRTGSNGLPHTAVVDPSGQIAWTKTGTTPVKPIVEAARDAVEG